MCILEAIVSVIAPVFNGEKYIQSFIDSIRNQSFTEWELILVDDGSTDKSISIIKDNVIRDKRIRLICRNSELVKGANTCRNIGQRNAKGKYFIVLDSDDIVEEYCLKQRTEYMEHNPDLDYAVFPGVSLMQGKDGFISRGNRRWGINRREKPIISLLKAEYNFGVWNLIFNNKKFGNYFWDEKLKIYMDFDFLFRLLIGDYKGRFAEKAEPDYGYVQGRDNAITASFVTDEKYKSTIYLFNKTLAVLRKMNNPTYIDAYYYFFLSFYRKVIHSKNYEIYKDFFSFYLASFPEKRSTRLKLINMLIVGRIRQNKTVGKLTDYLITLLFYPQNILKRITKKFN